MTTAEVVPRIIQDSQLLTEAEQHNQIKGQMTIRLKVPELQERSDLNTIDLLIDHHMRDLREVQTQTTADTSLAVAIRDLVVSRLRADLHPGVLAP